MIRFLCPWCDKRLKSPETWAGRVARCPRCQGTCRVPDPFPVYPYVLHPLPQGDRSDLKPSPVPMPRTLPEQCGLKLHRRILGLFLLGALAGLFLLSWQEILLDHLRTRLWKWKNATL